VTEPGALHALAVTGVCVDGVDGAVHDEDEWQLAGGEQSPRCCNRQDEAEQPRSLHDCLPRAVADEVAKSLVPSSSARPGELFALLSSQATPRRMVDTVNPTWTLLPMTSPPASRILFHCTPQSVRRTTA